MRFHAIWRPGITERASPDTLPAAEIGTPGAPDSFVYQPVEMVAR